MERLSGGDRARSPAWKWQVCGILLLATMLNYMDRQTLAVTITDISRELHLNNEQYGKLEFGFGLAFAVGGLVTGLVADFVSIRWLYPLVLAGWSLSGFAAAYAESIGELLTPPALREAWSPAYVGLLACRISLGFFEAGQWPCALVTSQRLLAPQDRPLGNSLLQSGAAIGAILTPLVVQMLVSDAPGSWRRPFQVIGVLGLAWIVPWLLTVREGDLRRTDRSNASPPDEKGEIQPQTGKALHQSGPIVFCRRFAALLLTVILINLCFHFFRAWLPKFLREFHGYNRSSVNYFTAAYFIAADCRMPERRAGREAADPGRLAASPGSHDDVCRLRLSDRAQHAGGPFICGDVAAGTSASYRLWRARPVSQLLFADPGPFDPPSRIGHRRTRLRHMDLHRHHAESSRPASGPDRFLRRWNLYGRTAAARGLCRPVGVLGAGPVGCRGGVRTGSADQQNGADRGNTWQPWKESPG